MGLFGNKKKGSEPVRTLSEREIQSRLYGHLREPSTVQEDLPSFSRPKQDSSVLHKTNSTTNKTFTPSAPPVVQKPSILAPELFEPSSADLEKGAAASKNESVAQPKRHESIYPKPSVSQKQNEKKPATSGADFQKSAGQGALVVGQALKTVAFKIIEFLGFIIGTFLRIITSVNFKKPAVRRSASIVFGVGLLGLVLFGIHLLNTQRETAMKNPSKVVPASASAKALKTQSLIAAQDQAVLSVAADTETKPKQAKKPVESTGAVLTPADPAATTPVREVKPVAETTITPVTPVQKIEGPSYVVQVATFAVKEDAQKLADRFKADSLRAFIKPLSRTGGRVYYCVFIGQFKTHSEAETALEQFKKREIAQPFQDAFIRLMS